MPVIVYDTKDDVPSDVAEFAVEIKDGNDKGKFSVNLVPRKKMEDFRDNNTDLANKFRDAEGIIGKFRELHGIKPDADLDFDAITKAYGGLIEIEKGVKDGKIQKSEDIENELKKRTEQMREKYDKAAADKDVQIALMKRELDDARKDYDMTFVDRAVADAVLDAALGVHPTAVSDITRQARDVFTLEKDKSLMPKDGNDQPIRSAEDGITPMSVKEWIDTVVRKKWPQ